MNRLFSAALVLTLALCLALTASADNLKLRRGSSAPVDSITFVGVDTVRTSNISTRNWDMGTTYGAGAATTAAHAVATVTFWTPNGSALVGDSLLFVVEPSFDGGVTYQQNGLSVLNLGLATASIGNCAVLSAISGGVTYYRGYIIVDPDQNPGSVGTAPTNNDVRGFNDFRLKIFSDTSSGAATAIGSVYCRVDPIGGRQR